MVSGTGAGRVFSLPEPGRKMLFSLLPGGLKSNFQPSCCCAHPRIQLSPEGGMAYNRNLGPVPKPESSLVFWAEWAPPLQGVQRAHSRQNEITFLYPPPERIAWLTAAATVQVKWQQLVCQGEAGVWALGSRRMRGRVSFRQ